MIWLFHRYGRVLVENCHSLSTVLSLEKLMVSPFSVSFGMGMQRCVLCLKYHSFPLSCEEYTELQGLHHHGQHDIFQNELFEPKVCVVFAFLWVVRLGRTVITPSLVSIP